MAHMAQQQPLWKYVTKKSFDVFVNIRETVVFYMFILEEAIQTMSMSVWQAYQAGDKEHCYELINYNLNELIYPLRDFANGPIGALGWPMNASFAAFAEASAESMKNYWRLLAEEE